MLLSNLLLPSAGSDSGTNWPWRWR